MCIDRQYIYLTFVEIFWMDAFQRMVFEKEVVLKKPNENLSHGNKAINGQANQW